MRILSIRLVNFVGVQAAMGLRDISFSFQHLEKPIVQLYGKNRCGKTVLIQQLHPFSSINLNGDERGDLSLIIPGEIGIKEITYDVDGKIYHIQHTYKPTSKTHTVSSSLKLGDEELNASGGVNTFNQLIESVFGINKYRFQFIINGTQLTSFANMGGTQRKTLLNRAMGIDIYDKIHKLATDDYRYTNKLIASLANTQSYLLRTYGSYETLQSSLLECKSRLESLQTEQTSIKSKMDHLSGKLQTLRAQNPEHELHEIQRQCEMYTTTSNLFGGNIDSSLYDRVVDEQIKLNQQLSELRSQYAIVLHDIDDRCAKRREIELSMISQQNAIRDLENMQQLEHELVDKINAIEIIETVETPSSYLRTMLSVGQAINSICNEIVTCLSEKQLALFDQMIQDRVDIAAFLVQEGAVLMDSEKEKSVVSRIQSMMNSISGDDPTECSYGNCVYRRTYDTLQKYFKSYHSTTESQFTQYDMEQFDHAYKNLQTINRMLVVEIPDDIMPLFALPNIIHNLTRGVSGVDVKRLQFMMEESAKNEQRIQYIKQLNDVKQSLHNMQSFVPSTVVSTDPIQHEIDQLSTRRDELKRNMDALQTDITSSDQKRVMLSNVVKMDINALHKRRKQLETIIDSISKSDDEFGQLRVMYQDITLQLQQVASEYDTLEKANAQYAKTMSEIELHTGNDRMYKVIAEATSSTKGKPVIAIRDTVNRALHMTNELLHVMYGSEIQLLKPMIDETDFTLPFRCGLNQSPDIRYGSQSESTLLSLAFSMSLASTLTPYNVFLIDECDGYLDTNAKDGFVSMLQEIMIRLNVEQLFIISHSVGADQYPHVVDTVDISKRIEQMKNDEK